MEKGLDFILRKFKKLLEDFEQRGVKVIYVHLKVIILFFPFFLNNSGLHSLGGTLTV